MQQSRLCTAVLVLLALAVSPAFAQFSDRDTLIGIDVGGPVFGIYSGSFEQVLLDDVSIYVRGGYENPEYSLLYRESINEAWELSSIGGQIGANYYPQNLAPEGLFAGVGLRAAFVQASDGTEEAETFTPRIQHPVGVPARDRLGRGRTLRLDVVRVGVRTAARLRRRGDPEPIRLRFLLSAGLDVSIAF